MKKLLPLLLLPAFLCNSAFANDDDDLGDPFDDGVSGYFVGVDSGYALTHYNDTPLFSQHVKKKAGYTGRAFFGYSLNPYFAVDGGYRYLPCATATFNAGNGSSRPVSVSHYLLDANLIVRLPFYHHFDAFVKAGMAYVSATMKVTGKADSHADEYRPTFGIGMDYRITPNFTILTQWTRVLAKANAFDGYAQSIGATKLPMLDTITMGVSYRF